MSMEVFKIVFPFWIRSFAFTVAVEVPVFVLIARWRNQAVRSVALWRLAFAGAVGTLVTHPLFWFVWPLVVSDYKLYIISGELIIAVVESFVFYAIARPIALSRATVASFVANGLSYGGGVLLYKLANRLS